MRTSNYRKIYMSITSSIDSYDKVYTRLCYPTSDSKLTKNMLVPTCINNS